jgi:type I restriction enzyme S subunit
MSDRIKCSYLPEDWEEIPLSQVCQNPVSGYSPNGSERPAEQDEVGVLKLNCIQNNRFNPENNKSVIHGPIDQLKTSVTRDTLLVSRSNTEELVGAVCYIERDYPNLFLSDLLWRVSAKNGRDIDLKWLSYLLSFAPYRAKILARAHGTSGSMKKINRSGFLGIRIAFPSLDEQRKISEILSVWDTAISLTRRLIDTQKDRRQALRQQLLTGKRRLPAYLRGKGRKTYHFFDLPVDWGCPRIREIAEERVERNKGRNHGVVLSCTKHSGFVVSAQYFGRQVFSEDTSRYKIIRRGWFGYPSNHIEEGSIGLLSEHSQGIVSPIYTVFECSDRVVPEYLYAVFKTETFRHIFAVSTNASVDRRGSLRWSGFSRIRVPLPEKEEQQAIVNILAAADLVIAGLEKRITALERQKRGLMQKLLTGQVRVNPDTA